MRVIVGVAVPVLAQLVVLYLIIDWAQRDGSDRAFYPLIALVIMGLAIPIGIVANAWMIRETRRWRFPLVLLVAVAQAMVIPAAIVLAFLLGID